jgi:hypothetical protein
VRPAILAILAAIFAFPGSGHAGETEGLLERWYAALRSADRAAFEALLAPEARIEIRQFDLVQSTAEFIESLDAWEEAVEGATIEHRLQENTDAQDEAQTLVCYHFPSNAELVRETFRLAAGRVAYQLQEKVADDCAGF